ncbi:MAG: hypothetical protein WCK89_21755, partial [bacterium]
METKTLLRLSVLCFMGSVLLFQTGCEDGDHGPSASEYGITNASMAALVVKDQCPPFYIKDITINNTASGQSQSLGGVADGQQGVFEIAPGN